MKSLAVVVMNQAAVLPSPAADVMTPRIAVTDVDAESPAAVLPSLAVVVMTDAVVPMVPAVATLAVAEAPVALAAR